MTTVDRRRFLSLAGGAGAASALAACQAVPEPLRPAALDPMLEWSASEAAARLRAGDVSAERYAEALIRQTQACQRALNAYIAFDADKLRAAARAADKARADRRRLGPLHGVPLAVKDNVDTTALPTSGATKALMGNVPRRDAPVWRRLAGAGALPAGKAGMHELAFGITNNNAATGAVRNPYDPRMIPGGSSGGTGAAIAARLAPAGVGSDTGGSVRIPAALCGHHGLRPSVGRYPGAGMVPISWTRDTAGPMARTVADLALMDAIMAGVAPAAPAPAPLAGLRLGLPRGYFWENLDSGTTAVMNAALAKLRAAGAVVVEADLPEIGKLNDAVSFPVALWEVVRALPAYLAGSAPGRTLRAVVAQFASPDVKGVLESQLGDKALPTRAYLAAVGPHRRRLQAAYAAYFARHRVEAMIFPTTPLTARPIGQDATVDLNGKQVPTFPTFIRNTDPGSNAGIPGLSLAAGLAPGGLPVGLALDAPRGADRRLLAIGAAVEAALGRVPAPRNCAA
jgi:mandelamide amidase